MAKILNDTEDSKLEVGDKVIVIASAEALQDYGAYCTPGEVYEISAIGKGKANYKLKGANWVKPVHLRRIHERLTKAQWLIKLLEGEIGLQSGNTDQRWRYNVDKGYFQAKDLSNKWEHRDINRLGESSRVFNILEEKRMTVAEIEEALGITNLVVVVNG